MSLGEFFDLAQARPEVAARNAFHYAADAIRAPGEKPSTLWGEPCPELAAARWPWMPDSEGKGYGITGADRQLNRLLNVLDAQACQPHQNKLAVITGPWGSGKTRLAETVTGAVDHYSRTHPDGKMYRVVFIFPERQRYQQTGIGFNDSSAGSAFEDVGFMVRPTCNTNPLFLLPNDRARSGALVEGAASLRGEFWAGVLASHSDRADKISHRFGRWIMAGKLDPTTDAMIRELLQHHNGDWNRVVDQHIRVEEYSPATGSGVSQPTGHEYDDGRFADHYGQGSDLFPASSYDARQAMPPELPDAKNIPDFTGVIPAASGGIIFLDNFLGGATRLDKMNPLQEPVESGFMRIIDARGNVHAVPLNAVFLATMGDPTLDRVRGEPEWTSHAGRMTFIQMGHRLRFGDEAHILNQQIRTQLPGDAKCDPQVARLAALFTAMTRLRAPDSSHYSGGEIPTHLREAIRQIDPGEDPVLTDARPVAVKALILDSRDPAFCIYRALPLEWQLKSEQYHALQRGAARLADEFMGSPQNPRFAGYDGGFGISEREALELMTALVKGRAGKHLTVMDLVAFLTQEANKEFRYFSAAESAVENTQGNDEDEDRGGGIVEPSELVTTIEDIAKRLIRWDVIDGIGSVSRADIHYLVEWYLANVTAYVTREKIQPGTYGNAVVREAIDPDERLMRTKVEELLDIQHSRIDDHRSAVLRALGTARNNGGDISALPNGPLFEHCFPDLFWRLRTQTLLRHLQGGGRDVPPIWEIDQFIADLEEYRVSPGKLEANLQKQGTDVRRQAERYRDARNHLLNMGYPAESIQALVVWAFNAREDLHDEVASLRKP